MTANIKRLVYFGHWVDDIAVMMLKAQPDAPTTHVGFRPVPLR
jgi:hypothetical protein